MEVIVGGGGASSDYQDKQAKAQACQLSYSLILVYLARVEGAEVQGL